MYLLRRVIELQLNLFDDMNPFGIEPTPERRGKSSFNRHWAKVVAIDFS
jgi:hypothetical protein